MKREIVNKIILGVGGAILVFMLLNPPGDPWATNVSLRMLPLPEQMAVFPELIIHWAGRVAAVAIVIGLAWHFTRGATAPNHRTG